MFGVYHFIWLGICALLAALAAAYLRRHKPPLRRVLGWACAGCVLSEVVKILSVIELVPSADGSRFYPYLELAHLPFHLCSAQIALIFYARYAKDGPARTVVLAHLSAENNTPARALEVVGSTLARRGAAVGRDVVLEAAPRSETGRVYRL